MFYFDRGLPSNFFDKITTGLLYVRESTSYQTSFCSLRLPNVQGPLKNQHSAS